MSKLYYNKNKLLSELITINNNLDFINLNRNKPKKIHKKLFKRSRKLSRLIPDNEIDSSKLYSFNSYKYKLSNDKDIVLKGRYLEKYKDFIYYHYVSRDLLETGFYEYQFKLKQYLSKCGINRTKQFYGTCWFNCVLNGILFGHMKNKFIKLIDNYKKTIGNTKFNKFIENILKEKIKLDENIQKNYDIIFNQIVAIIYKISCQEGLRNNLLPDKKVYVNYNLTNLAISLKYLYDKDYSKIDINKDNLGYYSDLGLLDFIDIFNKFIDKEPHLMFFKIGNYNDYFLSNANHINLLFIQFTDNETNAFFSANYNVPVDNIELNYNNREIKFSSGDKLHSMKNIDFVMLSYLQITEDKDRTIPSEIIITLNNEQVLYKIDHACLVIHDKYNGAHVVTGFICNDKYYIYDSSLNFYYECDWLNLNNENVESIMNLDKIYSSDFIYKDNQFLLYDKKSMKQKYIDYEYVLYYNPKSDYTYDDITCKPERKN